MPICVPLCYCAACSVRRQKPLRSAWITSSGLERKRWRKHWRPQGPRWSWTAPMARRLCSGDLWRHRYLRIRSDKHSYWCYCFAMFCYVLLIGPIGPIDFLRALYQRLDQLACRSCAPRPIISYTGTCREKAKTWNAPATPEASRSPPTTGTSGTSYTVKLILIPAAWAGQVMAG